MDWRENRHIGPHMYHPKCLYHWCYKWRQCVLCKAPFYICLYKMLRLQCCGLIQWEYSLEWPCMDLGNGTTLIHQECMLICKLAQILINLRYGGQSHLSFCLLLDPSSKPWSCYICISSSRRIAKDFRNLEDICFCTSLTVTATISKSSSSPPFILMYGRWDRRQEGFEQVFL